MQSESEPRFDLTIPALVAFVATLMFAFFILTGQPLALSIGASLAFPAAVGLAMVLSARDPEITVDYSIADEVPAPWVKAKVVEAKVASPSTCLECGTVNADWASFCGRCGRRLGTVNPEDQEIDR